MRQPIEDAVQREHPLRIARDFACRTGHLFGFALCSCHIFKAFVYYLFKIVLFTLS